MPPKLCFRGHNYGILNGHKLTVCVVVGCVVECCVAGVTVVTLDEAVQVEDTAGNTASVFLTFSSLFWSSLGIRSNTEPAKLQSHINENVHVFIFRIHVF